MTNPLVVQFRVITALVLREARVRHDRARFGYAWAIIEPSVHIIFLTMLFSQFRSVSRFGTDFALFFATGVLPFQLFRNTSQYLGLSILSNRPLFYYPPVRPFDAILARFLLDAATSVVVMILVFSVLIAVGLSPVPADFAQMALALSLQAALALGVGMILATVRVVVPWISTIYTIIMGGSFFLSCVFYSLTAVPSNFRDILVWNPLVHGVEGFRAGYLGGYRTPDVSLIYLGEWALGTIIIGLLLMQLLRRSMP